LAEQQRQKRSLGQAILKASLPDEADFAKMLRYDALLFNQYLKLLYELQRLQAARQGSNPVLPIAVDLNVTLEDFETSAAGAVDAKSIIIDQPAASAEKRSRGRPRLSA
jgi:hypothetical protein